MNEQQRILEMIEKGQITAAEGMELLEALKEPRAEVPLAEVLPTGSKKKYEFLKVKVIADNMETRVNVNVPLKLVKSLGGVMSNINAYIPDEAKVKMNESGVNLDQIDIIGLINALEEGADMGPLVDIETEDKENGKTYVKVYFE